MAARRKIGQAMVYLVATDRETDDKRWIYEVRIAVGRKVVWSGTIMSQPGGVVVPAWIKKGWDKHPNEGGVLIYGRGEKRVALDSWQAYDAIARSAIRINSVFMAEQPDPPIEVADAINEATLEALDANEQYVISRRF